MIPFGHMLSHTRLRVLAELADCGSFSGAADALDYTQSAVSKQVAALEREVGMQLVLRHVRPVRLTAAGETLARHARAVLQQLATADAELEAIAALEAGCLRLGAFSSAGATLVVQALADFKRRFPGVEVTLLEAGPDKLVDGVRTGDLDLAIVFDFPALELTVDEGIAGRHLLDDPNDLLVHPEHRLARRKRVTFSDLRNEDWLFPTLGPDSPTQKLFTAACSGAGYEPRIVFRVNDCEMFQALVAADMGIGFLPRIALHPVHPGVVVKPVEGSPTRRILAVSLPGTRSQASEAFLELLEQYATAYPKLREPARA
jgi:DNA-binding transcriptional LysR family regulator